MGTRHRYLADSCLGAAKRWPWMREASWRFDCDGDTEQGTDLRRVHVFVCLQPGLETTRDPGTHHKRENSMVHDPFAKCVPLQIDYFGSALARMENVAFLCRLTTLDVPRAHSKRNVACMDSSSAD